MRGGLKNGGTGSPTIEAWRSRWCVVRSFGLLNQDASTRLHDRAYLLSDSKRNDVLELSEVERYGRDSYGDPGYVSIYGLRPDDWYAAESGCWQGRLSSARATASPT